MSRTVVGDCDVESDCVAYRWSRIATGQRFNGDQIGCIIDSYRLYQVVTDSRWIVLIAHRCGCDVGDRVAALAYINRAFKCQRYGFTDIQCPNNPQPSGRIVDSLSHSSVGCRGG